MPPQFDMGALMNYFQQQVAQYSNPGQSPLQKGEPTPNESQPNQAISQMSSQGHPGFIGDAFHAMLGSMLGNALGFTPAGAISAGGGTGTPAPSATAPNYAGFTPASSVGAPSAPPMTIQSLFAIPGASVPSGALAGGGGNNPNFVAGPNGNGPWAAINATKAAVAASAGGTP